MQIPPFLCPVCVVEKRKSRFCRIVENMTKSAMENYICFDGCIFLLMVSITTAMALSPETLAAVPKLSCVR